MKLPTAILALLALLLAGAVTTATAQTAPVASDETAVTAETETPPTAAQKIATWKGILDSAEQALARDGMEDDEFAELSQEAAAIRGEASLLAVDLEPGLRRLREQLAELGPPPGDGEPPESEEIAAKRTQLNEQTAKLDGEIKSVRLMALRAGQIEAKVSAQRRDRFIRSISKRSANLTDPAFWSAFAGGLAGMGRPTGLLITDSAKVMGERLRSSPQAALLLAAAIAAIGIVFVWVRRALARRRNRVAAAGGGWPGANRRAAALSFAADGLMPAGAILVVFFTLEFLDLLTIRLGDAAREFTYSLAAAIIAVALAHAFIRPDNGDERLVQLSDRRAGRVFRAIVGGVALAAAIRFINEIGLVVVAPFEVSIGLSLVLALIVCGTAIWVLMTVAADRAEHREQIAAKPIYPRVGLVRWGVVNPLIWLAALVGLGALITGYLALAEFASYQLLLGSVVFALLWLALDLIDQFRVELLDEETGQWRRISRAMGFSRSTILQAGVFAAGIAKLTAALIAALILLAPWGYRADDWRQLVSNVFFGFTVGGLTISVSTILLSIGLFFAGYLVTRAIQAWLGQQFLPTTALDAGLRNSIATVFGYVGIIVAALLALIAAGLDLSNLAIVAGALSVGIGFGLQSIVNNFVSGLILLAERPIKAGDWIVTAGGQGTVRKTSVRSTEIETFDGATIIVPNSTLITDSVTNWTHQNTRGRIIISIGVSYDSDPEQVRSILLDCAASHGGLLEDPEPIVFFMDFGADALMFELRAYLADIGSGLSVRSDLRFAILTALRDAGIEIPFPQRDIHIKSGELPAPATPAPRSGRAAARKAAK